MRRLVFTVVAAMGLLVMGGAVVSAGPPDVHKGIAEFTGPETCGMCHPNSAQEVVESVHYQHQAIPKYREGWPEGKPGGMLVTY